MKLRPRHVLVGVDGPFGNSSSLSARSAALGPPDKDTLARACDTHDGVAVEWRWVLLEWGENVWGESKPRRSCAQSDSAPLLENMGAGGVNRGCCMRSGPRLLAT